MHRRYRALLEVVAASHHGYGKVIGPVRISGLSCGSIRGPEHILLRDLGLCLNGRNEGHQKSSGRNKTQEKADTEGRLRL
jgi:hypothetical protein